MRMRFWIHEEADQRTCKHFSIERRQAALEPSSAIPKRPDRRRVGRPGQHWADNVYNRMWTNHRFGTKDQYKHNSTTCIGTMAPKIMRKEIWHFVNSSTASPVSPIERPHWGMYMSLLPLWWSRLKNAAQALEFFGTAQLIFLFTTEWFRQYKKVNMNMATGYKTYIRGGTRTQTQIFLTLPKNLIEIWCTLVHDPGKKQ